MHRLSCRSVLPMIRLVRGFKEQKWAEQFLRGDIYMNTLGYFWNEGNMEQQDFLEGACASFDPHIMRSFPKDLLGVLAKESYAIPRGAGYCNVCCFSCVLIKQVDTRVDLIELPDPGLDLGSWIVVIDNPCELISRLRAVVLQLGYDFVAAPVEYRDSVQLNPSEVVKSTMDLKSHDPLPAYMVFPNGVPHFNAGVFVKNVRYANQAEWRIAVNRNERSYEPLILKLGDLTDIAHLIRRTELTDDLQRVHGCSVPYLTRGCFGTKTSQELSQDLFKLGNEELFITLTVG